MLAKVALASCVGLLTVVATAADLSAQMTNVSSGCPVGPSILVPTGNFTVGTSTLVTVVPIACTGPQIALFVGATVNPPITVPTPLACPGPCLLSCNPIVTVLGPNPFIPLNLTLPNDPSLVGTLAFCFQAACVSTDPNGRPCVTLGDRLEVIAQ